MTLYFRPAERSQAKPIIGLYAESNGGKTYSALLLGTGFGGRITMIETESGRGEAWADKFKYNVIPITKEDGFSPRAYGEAIDLAEKNGTDVLIIDSASHEWEGVGGVLSMAAENQEKGKKGPLVWQVPKIEHQRYFMGKLLQTPIKLVIVCMRAKYPMNEEKKPGGGKEWVRSTVLEPKQSEDILFEMFVHGWIDKEQHAFHGTKYTRPELAEIIRSGEPITIETGHRLAAWARGESPKTIDIAAVIREMREAVSMAQLKNVSAGLKGANLSPDDDKRAREAYAERKTELEAK